MESAAGSAPVRRRGRSLMAAARSGRSLGRQDGAAFRSYEPLQLRGLSVQHDQQVVTRPDQDGRVGLRGLMFVRPTIACYKVAGLLPSNKT